MKNNKSGTGAIKLMALIIVLATMAWLWESCGGCDARARNYINSMSPKEYYAFSQRAYAYNHRND